MVDLDAFRKGQAATWAAGQWPTFAKKIAPIGARVVAAAEAGPGVELLDVGCGSGDNVAIPAAKAGAHVVGSDITPELLEMAKANAAEAGVEVQWVEEDAQNMAFADGRFDRVTSTFGAMFAPDHAKAASELVRVCKPGGGKVLMTTWVMDGFAGELFKHTGAFMPAPPEGVEPPPLWGLESHINEVFGASGSTPDIERQSIDFTFDSVTDAVNVYATDFGPFLTARAMLEPQGRWEEFLNGFGEVIATFNSTPDDGCTVTSDYFLITVNT